MTTLAEFLEIARQDADKFDKITAADKAQSARFFRRFVIGIVALLVVTFGAMIASHAWQEHQRLEMEARAERAYARCSEQGMTRQECWEKGPRPDNAAR